MFRYSSSGSTQVSVDIHIEGKLDHTKIDAKLLVDGDMEEKVLRSNLLTQTSNVIKRPIR